MRLPILIEPLPHNRFRAVGPVDGLSAEGSTPEEARAKLEEVIRQRLAAGAQLSWVEADPVPAPNAHPLARHAGTWRNDPLVDEYREAIDEYRRERDIQDAPK